MILSLFLTWGIATSGSVASASERHDKKSDDFTQTDSKRKHSSKKKQQESFESAPSSEDTDFPSWIPNTTVHSQRVSSPSFRAAVTPEPVATATPAAVQPPTGTTNPEPAPVVAPAPAPSPESVAPAAPAPAPEAVPAPAVNAAPVVEPVIATTPVPVASAAFDKPISKTSSANTYLALGGGLVIIAGLALGLWTARMQIVGLPGRRNAAYEKASASIRHNKFLLWLAGKWMEFEVRGLSKRAPELKSIFRR